MREHPNNSRKILVLYIGGTIGMQKNNDGVYIPSANTFYQKIKSIPEMHDENLAKKLYGGEAPSNLLVIPHIECSAISYLIKEYNPLLDSSNMSINDWIRIAKDIGDNYNFYDGFVVLHGTDTLAYTASALSFMLDGLDKTVIVTGSQIPIFEARTDGKDNFLSSLIFSACYDIPEVCVCFANKLLRGNRTVKTSSNLLSAFSSPNYHCLGSVGIKFKVHNQYVRKHEKNIPFKVHTNLNHHIGMLSLFPTFSSNMLESFLKPPMEGIVLQSYGIGNIPNNKKCITKVLKDAVSRGVFIVNITQCAQGTVSATYETGQALESLGIISGNDMTAEAALAKLSYVLGRTDLTMAQKKEMIIKNIQGELTTH